MGVTVAEKINSNKKNSQTVLAQCEIPNAKSVAPKEEVCFVDSPLSSSFYFFDCLVIDSVILFPL